jgi:hypothetical protein
MKYTFLCLALLGLFGFAYFSAQQKLKRPTDVSALQLGMSQSQLESAFGAPSAQERNKLTYILEDSSELIVSLREGLVSSAQLKFNRRLKIEDPKLRQLTLVQMDSESFTLDRPSWFFAGKPEEGLIYKITAEGLVESMTWVPPFTYGRNQAKALQALLKDFKNQYSL